MFFFSIINSVNSTCEFDYFMITIIILSEMGVWYSLVNKSIQTQFQNKKAGTFCEMQIKQNRMCIFFYTY